MQKKIIALAVAGLVSGAAFAQSNVTIYGVADATFDMMRVSGDATPANNVSYNRVSTNSSLIGFKGAEDLGNGMKAVFQYESSAGFDAAGAFSANRDSFVGLSGGFGTVVLGNLTGPTRAFGAAVDVNAGATGIGANSGLIGKLGNGLTGVLNSGSVTTPVTPVGGTIAGAPSGAQLAGGILRSTTNASAFDNRFQNAVAYISPEMSGFTVIGGYVANENKAAGAINTSAYDLGVKYANGPLMAGLSHADVKVKDVGVDTHPSNTRLVGMYDFGSGSVRALYDQTKMTVVGGDAKQTVWGLGATFNVTGNGKLIGQYYKAADVKGTLGGSNTGAKLYEIGYEHSLSKRTMLKAVYAKMDNDTFANYDLGVNGTGLSTADASISGIQVGLRHTF